MNVLGHVRKVTMVLLLIVMSVAGIGKVSAQTPEISIAPPKKAIKTPDELVRALYAVHKKGDGPIFNKTGKQYLERFFDPRLAALLMKNIIGPPSGEIGNLDFDPLFNAQDIGISNLRVAPTQRQKDPANSVVIVTFKNYDRPNRLLFHLHKIGAAWKIQDIDYGSGEGLVKILSHPF